MYDDVPSMASMTGPAPVMYAGRPPGPPGSMTLYGLRHAAATLMIDAGESVKTVQAQLGHASPAITMQVYAQAVAKSQAAAAARLGSLLRAPFEPSAHPSRSRELLDEPLAR